MKIIVRRILQKLLKYWTIRQRNNRPSNPAFQHIILEIDWFLEFLGWFQTWISAWAANIQPILNELQKTSKSLRKWLIFGKTSKFFQFWLHYSFLSKNYGAKIFFLRGFRGKHSLYNFDMFKWNVEYAACALSSLVTESQFNLLISVLVKLKFL